MLNNYYILLIKKTATNLFVAILNNNNKLIFIESTGHSITTNFKASLTNIIFRCITKINENFIKFIYLSLKHIPDIYLQYVISIIQTWKIDILYINTSLNVPHNGCRLPHISRKKQNVMTNVDNLSTFSQSNFIVCLTIKKFLSLFFKSYSKRKMLMRCFSTQEGVKSSSTQEDINSSRVEERKTSKEEDLISSTQEDINSSWVEGGKSSNEEGTTPSSLEELESASKDTSLSNNEKQKQFATANDRYNQVIDRFKTDWARIMVNDPLLSDEAKANVVDLFKAIEDVEKENKLKKELAEKNNKDNIQDAEVISIRHVSLSDIDVAREKQKRAIILQNILIARFNKKFQTRAYKNQGGIKSRNSPNINSSSTPEVNTSNKKTKPRTKLSFKQRIKLNKKGGRMRRFFLSTFLGKKLINFYFWFLQLSGTQALIIWYAKYKGVKN